MSLRDYAHWNEDAQYMWWQEEGRHPYEPEDNDDMDDRGWDAPRIKNGVCTHCDDEDAWCELCGEHIKHFASGGAMGWAEEAAEWVQEDGEHIIAHAQCGIDWGLEQA